MVRTRASFVFDAAHEYLVKSYLMYRNTRHARATLTSPHLVGVYDMPQSVKSYRTKLDIYHDVAQTHR